MGSRHKAGGYDLQIQFFKNIKTNYMKSTVKWVKNKRQLNKNKDNKQA